VPWGDMTSGSCVQLVALPAKASQIVAEARRAVLATVDGEGRPHVVPVCYAIRADELVTAIDHKPKSGRKLARVANIEANGRAAVLLDRWSEEWHRLGWVMVRGTARLEQPGSADAQLLQRYRQYREAPPRGPVIAVRPEHISWWTWE
jgi:PPOX class probable F420-dependent enzyme